MRRLFEKLARPMATMETPSAFLKGLRWMEKGEEVVYRLITDLIDYEMFPSLVLADEYHWRWEIENTLSEFKTHLNARKTPIRSKKPKLVVQEIYPKGYTSLWLVIGSLGNTFFDFSRFYYYR
jgi:hypothetical protein